MFRLKTDACEDPGLGLSGESQVAIGFLRNTGTNPLEKQLDPKVTIASKGRSVRPSVNYIDY